MITFATPVPVHAGVAYSILAVRHGADRLVAAGSAGPDLWRGQRFRPIGKGYAWSLATAMPAIRPRWAILGLNLC
ncbi:MAG: hypothetical protein IPL99_07155 [Candidatus Competibacteraceae bacterium]|nr:hypothetical protein [Candidatus Competibacteraceae bacterium]